MPYNMQAVLSNMYERLKTGKQIAHELEENRSSRAHNRLTPKNSSSGRNSRTNSMKRTEPFGRTTELSLSVLDRTLTIVEKRALRVTWIRMQGRQGTGAIKLCDRVFDKLSRKDAQMRAIFCQAAVTAQLQSIENPNVVVQASTTAHAKMLSEYLDFVISWLNFEENGLAYKYKKDANKRPMGAKDIGRAHVSLAVCHQIPASIWETFGEILAEEVMICQSVRNCLKGHRAWNLLIVTVIDHFRAGYENAIKLEQEHNKGSNSRTGSPASGAGCPVQGQAPYRGRSSTMTRANNGPNGSTQMEHVQSKVDALTDKLSHLYHGDGGKKSGSSDDVKNSGEIVIMDPSQQQQQQPPQVQVNGPIGVENRRGSWHYLYDSGNYDEAVNRQNEYFDRLFDSSAIGHDRMSVSSQNLQQQQQQQ